MIGEIRKETWMYNNTDELPVECVPNWQPAYNVDTGETVVFDAEEKKWKKL
jgi:hypothetical protein